MKTGRQWPDNVWSCRPSKRTWIFILTTMESYWQTKAECDRNLYLFVSNSSDCSAENRFQECKNDSVQQIRKKVLVFV